MTDVHGTIDELDKLIESGAGLGDRVELLQKIRDRLAARETAVEKISAFMVEFEKTCGLFAEASAALQAADDYASGIDVKIAESIDEHLRAVGALCRYGTVLGSTGAGFGCDHHFAES